MSTHRKIKFNQAISEALIQAMAKDRAVFIMGEGVDDETGIFGTTREAFLRFGGKRVIDTPLSENSMTGFGFGAALSGLRPVMVHARNDFLMLAMDQIVNHIAKWSYIHRGKVKIPLVIRALIGRGWGQAAQHSQSLQALFAHIPGLKVVMPSTPFTAKGLLLASIFDGAPVIFLEHRWLFSKEGEVPEIFYKLPLGKALIHRRGRHLTMVVTSLMVYEALEAANNLSKEGIETEVIDLLTIRPLDEQTILKSVRKTGRIIIADTGWRKFGVAAEISALINEKAFSYLKAPIIRIGLPDASTPGSAALEQIYYPGPKEIITAAKKLLALKSKTVRRLSSKQSNVFTFTGPF